MAVCHNAAACRVRPVQHTIDGVKFKDHPVRAVVNACLAGAKYNAKSTASELTCIG
jgi:hypothetical protein